VARAFLAILVLVLSACRAVGGGPTPTATATASPTPAPAVIELRAVQDGCCFIEGAMSYATLEGPSPHKEMALEDGVDRDFDINKPFVIGMHRLPVAPGHYVLKVWQRPCDGNCGYLDPPVGMASKEFDVIGGEHLSILITFRLMDPAAIQVGHRS
jgi:hypothetical protein